MKVLFNKIIVKAPETEKTSESGLIMKVEQSYSSIISSEVVYVGEKKETSIKVGDKVIYPVKAGMKYSRDDGEYIILDEKDIIAIE